MASMFDTVKDNGVYWAVVGVSALAGLKIAYDSRSGGSKSKDYTRLLAMDLRRLAQGGDRSAQRELDSRDAVGANDVEDYFTGKAVGPERSFGSRGVVRGRRSR